MSEQVEAGWQPISSAPKDGTEVLVLASDPGPFMTFPPLPTIQRVASWHPDAGWCVCEVRQVTHWRPLPSPPEP